VRCFELDEPGTVAETIDDEAVVINLERGVYFSIRGSGLAIWTELLAHTPLEALVAAWQARFPEEAARIEAEIGAFVAGLVAEGLIRARAAAGAPAAATGPTGALAGYDAPRFEKYTDMEALLLLDPIHDTDDKGWPHRP